MIASRPDLSVDVTVRCGSRNRSTLVLLATHRQGWLLCSEGARHANSTAVLITLVSAVGWVIIFTCLLYGYDPRACEHLTPESLVPGVRSLDPRETASALRRAGFVSRKRFSPRTKGVLTDDFRLYCGMDCSENDGDAQATEKGQSWQRTAESNTLR